MLFTLKSSRQGGCAAELAWTQSIAACFESLEALGRLLAQLHSVGEAVRHACVKQRHYLLESSTSRHAGGLHVCILTGSPAEVSQLGRLDYFVHHPVAKEQFLPFLQACTQGKTLCVLLVCRCRSPSNTGENPLASCSAVMAELANQLHELGLGVSMSLVRSRLNGFAKEMVGWEGRGTCGLHCSYVGPGVEDAAAGGPRYVSAFQPHLKGMRAWLSWQVCKAECSLPWLGWRAAADAATTSGGLPRGQFLERWSPKATLFRLHLHPLTPLPPLFWVG